jgi:hypothetical protein
MIQKYNVQNPVCSFVCVCVCGIGWQLLSTVLNTSSASYQFINKLSQWSVYQMHQIVSYLFRKINLQWSRNYRKKNDIDWLYMRLFNYDWTKGTKIFKKCCTTRYQCCVYMRENEHYSSYFFVEIILKKE